MKRSNKLIQMRVDLKLLEFVIRRLEDDIIQLGSSTFMDFNIEDWKTRLASAREDHKLLSEKIELHIYATEVIDPLRE